LLKETKTIHKMLKNNPDLYKFKYGITDFKEACYWCNSYYDNEDKQPKIL